MSFLLILSHFRLFLFVFKIILLIILQYFSVIKIRALVICLSQASETSIEIANVTQPSADHAQSRLTLELEIKFSCRLLRLEFRLQMFTHPTAEHAQFRLTLELEIKFSCRLLRLELGFSSEGQGADQQSGRYTM